MDNKEGVETIFHLCCVCRRWSVSQCNMYIITSLFFYVDCNWCHGMIGSFYVMYLHPFSIYFHCQFNTIAELSMAYMGKSIMHRWMCFFTFHRIWAADKLYRLFMPLYIAYIIYTSRSMPSPHHPRKSWPTIIACFLLHLYRKPFYKPTTLCSCYWKADP